MFKDISLRKPQGVSINRILGCNKEDVQRYFLASKIFPCVNHKAYPLTAFWVVIKKMFKDISLRKPQGVPINRILGCNKEDVQRYFLA